jgi:rod shape determining protein RodA
MLAVAGALLLIGLATVYSATTVPGAHEGLWIKQLWWMVIALGAAWIATTFHYRAHDSLAYPLYGVSLVLLVAVLVLGSSAYGAKRWLDLGPVRFQPSEIAKIATVFVLARRFSDPRIDLRKFKHWFPALLVALVPFVLVAREPDLGTSLAFPVILIAMYFWAGMPAGNLLLGLSPGFSLMLAFLLDPRHPAFWLVLGGGLALLLAFVRPGRLLLIAMLAIHLAVGFGMPIVKDHLHDAASRPSSIPTRTRRAPATRSSSRGSRSARAASPARAGSRARRRRSRSCRCAIPTSSSPWWARSAGCSAR